MFHRSLALATVLLGAASAYHVGCYPAYVPGKTYADGAIVSVKGEIATKEDCDPEEAGCPQTGEKTTTETATFNYECETAVWCRDVGYAPGGMYSDLAWKEMDQCVGAAVITAPFPDLGGCPAAFSDVAEYGGGDRVSVCQAGTEWCDVYQCLPDLPAAGKFCGELQYEPGTGQYWDQAWDKIEGSCSGTIAPTPAVTLDGMDDVGGCPSAYESGAKYKAGDRVSKANFVFECKPWPFDGWCGLAGYEPMPGVALATPDAWKEAWDVIGYCSGTNAPTSAPNFVSLLNVGGCPAEWEQGTNGFGYDEGDRVAQDGLVFQCKMWPFSAHCAQAGYEPLSTEWNDAWKDAWAIVGYCEGTLSPSSIGGLLLEGKDLGECPLREHKIGDEYDGGELAKVCEPAGAECCAVYKCAADLPNPSGWCGLNEAYSPGEGFAWKDAWSFEGYCCGHSPTLSPTQPPSNPPSCSGVELEVDVTTDNFPGETSWYLQNLCTGEKEAEMSESTLYTQDFTTYSNIFCVPKSRYEMVFVIEDSWGDGLDPPGSYDVKYDGAPVASGGGNFGASERTEFGDPCPSAEPSASSQPSLKPSLKPTVSSKPSFQPSISDKPSTSSQPSLKPSVSSQPSLSSQPTACGDEFTPLAGNGGTLLTTVSDCDDCEEKVDLPSTFNFLGAYPTDSILVISDGTIGVGFDQYVDVASEDLNPAKGGDIYTKTNFDGSFTVSYEGVAFSDGEGGGTDNVVNAQATIFDDGRVNICFGTGSAPSGFLIQSLVYSDPSFYPNVMPGFDANGRFLSGEYPEPGCFCFDPNA